jgi:hypothetical protein
MAFCAFKQCVSLFWTKLAFDQLKLVHQIPVFVFHHEIVLVVILAFFKNF